MKKLVFAATFLLPLFGLFADCPKSLEPIHNDHVHRFSFGLFSFGYEHIKMDSVYAGIDTKFSSILNMEKKHNKTIDSHLNSEVKIGYNHSLGAKDHFTYYIGTGFTLFSLEKKQVGKLKNWHYGAIGFKYAHQFGDIFEMGLNLKGHLNLYQLRYEARKVNQDKKFIPRIIEDSEGLPKIKLMEWEASEETKPDLVAVKTKDNRWTAEIGIPMAWHLGSLKNWELQFEPYYRQIPNEKLTHIIGSKLAVAYRY